MDEEIHDFPPGLHKLDMSRVSDVGEFPNTKARMPHLNVYALAIPSDELLRRTQWQGGIEYPTPDEAYSAPPPTQLSLGSGPMLPDGTTVVKNVDSNNITIESTSNSYNTHTNVTNIYIESGLLRWSQLDSLFLFTTLKVAQRKRKCSNLSEAKLRVPGCIAFWANPGLTTVELLADLVSHFQIGFNNTHDTWNVLMDIYVMVNISVVFLGTGARITFEGAIQKPKFLLFPRRHAARSLFSENLFCTMRRINSLVSSS